jgi:hypothetical protein
MGRKKQTDDAKSAVFNRLFGVKPETFERVKVILQKEYDKLHKRGGIPLLRDSLVFP